MNDPVYQSGLELFKRATSSVLRESDDSDKELVAKTFYYSKYSLTCSCN